MNTDTHIEEPSEFEKMIYKLQELYTDKSV